MLQETPPESPQADSTASERWEFALALLAIAALLALCTAGPILLGLSLGPGFGSGASLIGCVIWICFGPKPMPGFLAGIIAVNGLFIIAAIGLAQFMRWLVH